MKSVVVLAVMSFFVGSASAIDCEICRDVQVNGESLYSYVSGLTGDIEVDVETHTSSNGSVYTTSNVSDFGAFTESDWNVFQNALLQCGFLYGVNEINVPNILSCDLSAVEAQVNEPLSIRIILLNLVGGTYGGSMTAEQMNELVGCLVNSIPGFICADEDLGDVGGDDDAVSLIDSVKAKSRLRSSPVRRR